MPTRRALRYVSSIAMLAVAYAASAKFGMWLAAGNEHVTAVWPPTGISVVALLLGGRRLWPGITVGAFTAETLGGISPGYAAAIAVGNTLAPLLVTVAFDRLPISRTFDRVADVLRFIGATGMAMLISASVGSSIFELTVGSTRPAALTWLIWWVGDSMGVILVVPVVMLAVAGRATTRRLELASFGIIAALLTFVLWTSTWPVRHLLVPVALLAALRLGPLGAAGLTFVISSVAIGTAAWSPQPDDFLLLMTLNGSIALTSMTIAAVMVERDGASEGLRAAAARRLATSEARLAEAQRLAHIGSFFWDATTDTNTWTEELFRIYKLDPSGPAPKMDGYISFIDPSVRDRVRTTMRAAIEKGEPIGHTYPVVVADGSRKWVHAYIKPTLDATGQLVSLQGTCQDVTEQVQVEQSLRASEQRMGALLDSAPDAIVVVNAAGVIERTNDQTTELLGYAAEEMLGRHVEMLLPTELRHAHATYREDYVDDAQRRPMGAGADLCARRKDGSLVPVDVSLSPATTDEGVVTVAALRDATERRGAEDAMRDAFERERLAAENLRRLDASKNAFLSAVSHELRTPLTAILGFSELLEDDEVRTDPDIAPGMVQRLRSSAVRLSNLLSDLLDIDRLHRGIVEPRRRATPIRDLVLRAIGMLDLGAHPLEVEADDATANVDPAQAERIIENLISNALRYTPPATPIRLRAALIDDGGLDITVADDGPGISPELRETIFEPFFREDTGTFSQGTGIGLALVDRFARLHSGRAEVTEGRNGGALFHVVLPGRALDTSVEPAVA